MFSPKVSKILYLKAFPNQNFLINILISTERDIGSRSGGSKSFQLPLNISLTSVMSNCNPTLLAYAVHALVCRTAFD